MIMGGIRNGLQHQLDDETQRRNRQYDDFSYFLFDELNKVLHQKIVRILRLTMVL